MERFTILAGTANQPLAEATARILGLALGGCKVERFPDGEISVQLEDSVRALTVFLIQPTAPPVNDHLVELVALIDACRRAAAARVVALLPYFGYARSDRRKDRRVPIMGSAAASMLENAGAQQIVTLDLHSPQVEGFFRIPVENLSAVPLLGEALRGMVAPETVIVAPDLGAVERASALAERLGLAVAFLTKRRLNGREVEVRQLTGEVRGRPCLIVDDMISTGGTIARGIAALREAGAVPPFRVAATHGLFVENAMEKLAEAGVSEIVVTDSIVLPESQAPKLRPVTVAPLLADAIHRLAAGESLRGLR